MAGFRSSYFWDARGLAHDLRAGAVSEGFRFKAFVTLITVYYLNSLPIGGDPDPRAFATWFSIAFSFVALVGSVALCFRRNQSIDNRDFVGRYVTLAVPLSIKLIALQLVVAIPLGLLLPPSVTPESPEFFAAEFWISMLLDLIWFASMLRYFRYLREAPAAA